MKKAHPKLIVPLVRALGAGNAAHLLRQVVSGKDQLLEVRTSDFTYRTPRELAAVYHVAHSLPKLRNAVAALNLGTGATVMDVGAHVGLFTLLLKSRYPDARVMAVEPDPELAELCRSNLSGLAGVSVVEAAVGATEQGSVAFYVNRESPQTNSLVHEYATPFGSDIREFRVPLRTLDSLASDAGWTDHIDLIKLDIQGAELEALRGGPASMAAARNMLVEMTFMDHNVSGLLSTMEAEFGRGTPVTEVRMGADLLYSRS